MLYQRSAILDLLTQTFESSGLGFLLWAEENSCTRASPISKSDFSQLLILVNVGSPGLTGTEGFKALGVYL